MEKENLAESNSARASLLFNSAEHAIKNSCLVGTSAACMHAFGVIHAIDDVDAVMQEMHRVLKMKGILVVEKTLWWSENKLLDAVTKNSLFFLKEKADKVFKFDKISKI